MDRSEISLFLERAFGRLDAWFQWYNETQSGICYTSNRLFLSDLLYLLSLFNIGEQMSSYYWRGRDNMTTLQLNPQVLICIHKKERSNNRTILSDLIYNFNSSYPSRSTWPKQLLASVADSCISSRGAPTRKFFCLTMSLFYFICPHKNMVVAHIK